MINTEITPSRLDRAFARFLTERTSLDGDQNQRFYELVEQLSFQQNHGHSCIAVDQQDQQLLFDSGLVSRQGERAPLIMDNGHLFTHRYWSYERQLADQLLTLYEKENTVPNLESALDRYFGLKTVETDWQRKAVQSAVTRAFNIITGGPGTGKTTTVVKILALLQEIAQKPLLIALAAPTGKAAMRLQEAISKSKKQLPRSDEIVQHIPETVTTLHRLLGARPRSPYFHYHAKSPLPHDLVIVDEASMVDLALMAKLVDALRPNARLILLGDKDQLASIEAGAVLADLTRAMPDCTVELKKSFRFNSRIKQFSDAVNEQNVEKAWKMLQAQQENIVYLKSDLIAFITEKQYQYLKLVKKAKPFEEIYHAFLNFQVLCSNRHGSHGTQEINIMVEQRLLASGLINKLGEWYVGRPVMITQNNAAMHLYNGDVGICLYDEKLGQLMVFFQNDTGVKKYLPTRLSHCETIFAMTIHKSQGSEFDEILIALPPLMNPVLGKELLYTAITRAKQKVIIAADKNIFEQTIKQKTERFGGLAEKIIETGFSGINADNDLTAN